MGIEDFSERRAFERIVCDFPLSFCVEEGVSDRDGSCGNISVAGLKVISSHSIKENRNIDIWLYPPKAKEGLFVKGKVIWCRVDENENWRAGIRFDSLFSLPLDILDSVESH